MNIDLNKTNHIIISHAHYDHGNGLKSFTQNFNIRPHITLSQYFFLMEKSIIIMKTILEMTKNFDT